MFLVRKKKKNVTVQFIVSSSDMIPPNKHRIITVMNLWMYRWVDVWVGG